LLMVAQAGF